jgi:hypothetical protein
MSVIPAVEGLKKVLPWLLIGVAIRLVLMPVSFYPDLLDNYWLAHYIVYDGRFNLGTYIFDRFGFSITGYLYLVVYFHALFLFLFRPLIPHVVWPDSPLLIPGLGTHSLYLEGLKDFLGQPNALSTIFLLKLPYLLLDVGCAFLIFKIIEDRGKALFAFKFWMLGFVNILVVCILGKYDIMAVFLVLLSLYWLRKGRTNLALLTLGTGIIVKLFPLLLLVPFVIVVGTRTTERLRLFILGLLPVVTLAAIVQITGPGNLQALLTFGLKRQFSFLLSGIPLGETLTIHLFPIGYAAIIFHCIRFGRNDFQYLLKCSLGILLLFYSVCPFHRQYLIWMMPFLALLIPEKKELLLMHIIQILCFIIFALDFGLLAVKLFVPLCPAMVDQSLHPPTAVRDALHPLRDALFVGSRILFSGVCFWMMYRVLGRNGNNES